MVAAAPVRSLPVVAYPPVAPRVSEAEVLRFESMLETADDAVQVCVEAQRKNAGWRAQDALCADAADAHLVAVLEAVAAATGAATPPPNVHGGTDRCELIRWTLESIMAMRNDTLRAAHTEQRAPGTLDPDHMGQCMELVTRLNAALSAPPRPQS